VNPGDRRKEREKNRKKKKKGTCTGPLKKTRCTAFESTADDDVTLYIEVARAPKAWRLHHTH